MPRKAARKQPKTDDGIIKYLISLNNRCKKSDSYIEKKISVAILDAKIDEDIRYLRAASAIIVLHESNSSCGKIEPLKFEEIKDVYDKIGDIPENFKKNPETYYINMVSWFKKKIEIKKGVFMAYA